MLWYSHLFNYRSNKQLNKHTKQKTNSIDQEQSHPIAELTQAKKASTIADHKNHYTQITVTNRHNAQAATPWRAAQAVASSLNPTRQT